MKTRIKVVKYENGVMKYIPQYKSACTWPLWEDVDPFGVVDTSCLSSVKKSIDEFIERNRKKKRRVPPVVSYIDYP